MVARLMKTCRIRSEGNDTGGYLAIFDLFMEVLNLMRPRKQDPDVRPAFEILQQKMENLYKVAKDNASQVSIFWWFCFSWSGMLLSIRVSLTNWCFLLIGVFYWLVFFIDWCSQLIGLFHWLVSLIDWSPWLIGLLDWLVSSIDWCPQLNGLLDW